MQSILELKKTNKIAQKQETTELMQIYLQFRQIFLLLSVFSQIFFSNFFSLKSFSSGSG